MRWIMVFAVGLTGLALAGCGGSKNASSETSTTTTTTTAAETTTGATTTPTTSDSETTPSTPNFASGKCKDLGIAAAKIGQDFAAGSGSGNLEDAAKEFQAFVHVVPSEIRGDVQTIADAMTKYAAALKGVHFAPGQTPSAADLAKIQAAAKGDQAKLEAAGKHIDAWVTKNCG